MIKTIFDHVERKGYFGIHLNMHDVNADHPETVHGNSAGDGGLIYFEVKS